MLGYSEEEFKNLRIKNILISEDFKEVKNGFDQIQTGEIDTLSFSKR